MKRISFGVLNDCAIVDYMNRVYSKKPLYGNEELRLYLEPYFPEELLSQLRIRKIKDMYAGVTGNFNNMIVSTGTKDKDVIKSQLIIDKFEINEENVIKATNTIITERKIDEKGLEEIKISRDSIKNKIIENNRKRIAKIIINIEKKEYQVFVDLEDVEKVKKYKWKVNLSGSVVANVKKSGVVKKIYLSNYILDISDYYTIIYRNGNKLDCRKENLDIIEDKL
jgi:hypothetical protein